MRKVFETPRWTTMFAGLSPLSFLPANGMELGFEVLSTTGKLSEIFSDIPRLLFSNLET